MIKFYDSGGTVHFGQATITRTTSVNGGLSLTGEVFAGDDVLNGLDYGWWLNFDNEKYVITYKKLSDDTNTVVFDAVQQFFWDFAKVALHAQYTGSHEYTFYLGQLFDKSGYTYKNDVTVPAFEKENWGYKNKLDLFNDIIDQADVEFEVHNETVHIAKQIGSDLTSFARKGINLSDLTEEIKISDFATYAKGYGAFKDAEDQSKGRLEVEYRSELAKQFGDLEMDPIVDERYTIADNLIAALKKQVDSTYTVSMTMNIYDLENAGYPNYEAPKVGDWILAIDEALNFKRKIRIIQLEEQFDVTGKRIGYTATCGDLSIVDQYTHLQISLDSKVQRIQETVDAAATSANGKNTNYYGAKEPVSANEGDLWFDQSNSDPDKWSIKQWANERWEQLTLNPGEVNAKVGAAKAEAERAVENANTAVDNANKAVEDAGFANDAADQAKTAAANAQTDASSAVAKADSAVASALNAQSDASDAVTQASSAAADSKDAKQIAGAVSQSYKTLTDGSTMTIAELEGGLAVKLTKDDLNEYATETWAQNQIEATADGINATLSSVKSTVDGHTTSINDLKADSSGFKAQFTTVNDTLGKHTTDIGTLKATSKELSSGFNTLTTDNTTNKNDISQLKQTATEVSSTLETVQTQVQDSAVGANLLFNAGDDNDIDHPVKTLADHIDVAGILSRTEEYTQLIAPTDVNGEMLYRFSDPATNGMHGLEPGQTYTIHGEVSLSKGDLKFRSQHTTTGGWIDYNGSLSETLLSDSDSFVNVSYTFTIPDNSTGIYISWQVYGFDSTTVLRFRRMKLEKGSVATDFSVNPADTASVSAVSKISQTVDSMKFDISKKIEQTDLNGYATQSWSQGQLSIAKNEITASVQNMTSDMATQKWTQGKIDLTADGFTSQISSVQTNLDGLSFGYRNLIPNGSFNDGFKGWTVGNSDSIYLRDEYRNNNRYTMFNGNGSNIGIYADLQNNAVIPLQPNTEYILRIITRSVINNHALSYLQEWDSTGNLINDHAFFVTQTDPTHYSENIQKFTTSATADHGTFRIRVFPGDQFVAGEIFLVQGNKLPKDWIAAPEDMATAVQFTSLEHTLKGVQSTANDAVTQSQYTQLANQFTSTIDAVASGNLVADSGWTGAKTATHPYYSGPNTLYQLANATTGEKYAMSPRFRLKPNTTYTLSIIGFAGSNVSSADVFVLARPKGSTSGKDYDHAYNLFPNKRFSTGTAERATNSFTTLDDDEAYIRIDNNGTNNGVNANVYFTEVQLEEGSIATPYKLSVSAAQSQITQLQSDVNLRVQKDDVINQINISPESILIDGQKVHITGQTTIDNAVIKDAMIESINAEKIQAGTIDADKIQVIHLNANNITAGIINGSNLSINLNTGNVEFQAGRVHNASNTIDINIDSGYMSVANGSNRVMLKDGEMQFVQPGTYDTSTDPYLNISNTFGGQSTEGAAFIGRKYAVLTNSDNATGNGIFDIGLGTEKFSGFATGYGSGLLNKGWHMTKVGGAERGVVISGGKATSYRQYWSASPSIMVGATQTSTSSGGMNGSNIIMDCDYLYNFSTWMRTSSHAANVYVADDGAIVRASSASKYKTNIERSFETGMGERILEVPTAHWFDKAEVLNKTLDPQAPDPRRYFGMIADDVDDAGLTELVEYNDRGEVEGLMYDRITLTLIPIIRNYRDRITKLESEIKQLTGG